MASAGIRVTLKRSKIGLNKSQKDTVRCLGLRKINDTKVVPNNPAMRGQIYKIQHLLEVKVES